MPFTLAHPAAILPFLKISNRYRVFSALVIGSMIPDVVYFLPIQVTSSQSHSFLGLFWFCVPMGLFLYLLFHAVFKRPLLFLLPTTISHQISIEPNPDRNSLGARFFFVTVSLVIGAITHVVWDSFTHQGSFFVERFPEFQRQILQIGGYRLTVFKVLQHGSTLFGFVLILYVLKKWHSTTSQQLILHKWPIAPQYRTMIIITLLIVPTIYGLIIDFGNQPHGQWLQQIQQLVGRLVIASGQALIVCLVFYAVLWQMLALLKRESKIDDSTSNH